MKDLVEHAVRGQYLVALLGSQPGHPGERGRQQHRADKDIPVQPHQLAQFLAVQKPMFLGPPARCDLGHALAYPPEPVAQAQIGRDHRAERDAVDIHAQSQHEEQIQADVRDRDDQLHLEQTPGQLLPREPAHDREIGQLGRCRPDADREIDGSERLGAIAALEDPHQQAQQRRLKQDQQQRDHQREDQGAGQNVDDPSVIPRAKGLGPQGTRAELQEVEHLKHKADGSRTQRDRSQIDRIPQIADDRGIDRPLQGDRGVRQHDRQRDGRDAPIAHFTMRDGPGHAGPSMDQRCGGRSNSRHLKQI